MENNSKADFSYFKRMFAFVKPYKFRYCIGMFFYNVQGYGFSLIVGVFLAGIMAAVVAGDIGQIWDAIFMTLGMFVIFMPLVGIGIYMSFVSVAKAMRELKRQLFAKFVSSSLESSQASHSGESVAAINTDANTAEGIVADALSGFLRSVLGAGLAAITIYFIDWRLGLAATGLGVLIFFAQNIFTKPLARINKARLGHVAEAVKGVSDAFAGAMPIRAYNMQSKALRDFETPIGKIKILDIRTAFIEMFQSLFDTIGGWLSLVITFVLGGWLVASGELDFPTLMLMLSLMQGISQGIGDLGRSVANLQGPLVAAKRVFDILDTPASDAEKRKDLPERFKGYALDIKKLDFAYLDSEKNTLSDINLHIPENHMVAFVGESGSGKSTLLRAIIGMYERENMPIYLGEQGFGESSVQSWRARFAYVDQSCKLFNISIAENIAIGQKKGASQDEIEAAAKRAFAHDFIGELEEGYNTDCGEKGGSLSGGQKQRIAIARALATQSPILVFDEATSALDKDSEKYVMQTIENLRSDHTILITTHNLENITSADSIVVLDGGNIAEIGAHEELIAKNGVYARLYNEQMLAAAEK